jgi:predicted dinucleotide-binding enzyme
VRAGVTASALLPRGEGVVAARPMTAADCELVIVATPWDSAIATVKALRQPQAGKIVISMVNALAREGKRDGPALSRRAVRWPRRLAFALPESVIVGAFHHCRPRDGRPRQRPRRGRDDLLRRRPARDVVADW